MREKVQAPAAVKRASRWSLVVCGGRALDSAWTVRIPLLRRWAALILGLKNTHASSLHWVLTLRRIRICRWAALRIGLKKTRVRVCEQFHIYTYTRKAAQTSAPSSSTMNSHGQHEKNRSSLSHEDPGNLDKPTDSISGCPKWPDMWKEVKLQTYLAGPLIVVSLLQMAFQLISIMFVGHLGELALSSSSIAISVANVTGMCVMMGVASSLETLCGQAYGAKQYQLLGFYLQTGLIVLNALAILLSFVYGYMGVILAGLGQDKLIAAEAGKYAKWLIPTLFAQASSQALIRFLQTQSLVYPTMLCSGIAVACHVPLCWVLVYKTSIGFIGAALSTSVCNWINVILLYGYVLSSSSCKKTRAPLSLQALDYMKSFIKLALPSAAMICLEWWCYEILVLLAGLLPNPELQTSTLSVCLNLANLTFQIPFGLAATASTRVSNELGAGQPQAAERAVRVAVSLTMSQACAVSMLLLAFRRVLGHIFSSDLEVIENVAVIIQLLAISSLLDSTQAILSGIVRGCGWQTFGAFINLSSFYIVALPVGACLGFLTRLQARGLWIGVICGPFVQVIALGVLIWSAKWDKEVSKAKQRVESSGIARPLLLQ